MGRDLTRQLRGSDSFAWHVTSAAQAKQGLEDGTYYMALTIPADFSSHLAHAGDAGARPGELRVTANEGRNLLASQIGSRVFLELRASLTAVTTRGYLEHIFVSLGDTRVGMSRAGRGATRLAAALRRAERGSGALTSGAVTARSGAATLTGGLTELSAGATRVQSGAAGAAGGARSLAAGVNHASAGAASLAGGDRRLAGGAARLASGLATLKRSGPALAAGGAQIKTGAAQISDGAGTVADQTAGAASSADQLADGAAQVQEALRAYAQAHPDAAQDAAFQTALGAADHVAGGLSQLSSGLEADVPQARQLASGAAQVSDGARDLSSGLSAYVSGVGDASGGAAALTSGAGKLAAGAGKLAGGLTGAGSGAQRLSAGTARLAAGTAAVSAATRQAHAGSATLTADLSDLGGGGRRLQAGLRRAATGGTSLAAALRRGAARLPDFSAQARRARAQVMSAPVTLVTRRDHPVPNYGTGFAPYFIPLALWVGALMAYFLVRPLGGRALASTLGDPAVVLAGLWPAVAITWLQSAVMLVVLQLALHLDPVRPLALYAFTLTAALAFTAVLQLLSAGLGTAGKFAAVVLLMLQLTSSAGTFPLQIAPRFFQLINPVLPMTYVVGGLRQAISGGDLRLVALDGLVLLGYTLGAVGLTMVVARRRRTWTMDRLKPVLTL